MKNYEVPVRAGEKLGDYKDWSFPLWQALLQCNIDQAAEREFYKSD